MLQLDEQKQAVRAIEPDLKDLGSALGIESIKEEVAQLDKQAADPNFWNDMEQSQKVLKKAGSLKATLSSYQSLVSLLEDTQTMLEMAEEDGDESMLPEIEKMIQELNAKIEEQRLSTLLSDFDLPRRGRRHRGPGLGGNALPDVHPLGRTPRVQGVGFGLPGRRRSGH